MLAVAGSSLLVLVMLRKAAFPGDIIPSYNSGSHLAEKVILSLFFICTRGGLEQSTSQSTSRLHHLPTRCPRRGPRKSPVRPKSCSPCKSVQCHPTPLCSKACCLFCCFSEGRLRKGLESAAMQSVLNVTSSNQTHH